MVILSCENLSKKYGERSLFENVGFHVDNDDKIGLTGANGCGKTTLFKLLTRELSPDSGQVHFSKENSIAYMRQHVCEDESHTVIEEVLSVFEHLHKMEKELSELHDKIENGNHSLIERQTFLTEEYEKLGGYTYKSRSKSALMRLGFSEQELSRALSGLSGGERSKVSLARLLLCNAPLLLLDEPTNHLDIDAVNWLEEYLRDYNGAYIVISHDRYFLDKVTKKTYAMSNSGLKMYMGNYSAHLNKKSEDDRILLHRYKNDMKEIGRIEGIIEQQRRWNREKNIKTAESKEKQLDKLKKTVVTPEAEADTLNFRFNIPECPANDILIARNISKSFDSDPLFNVENIHITKGERVFLLGSNGCGKTTLFKILTKQLECDSGSVTLGSSVLSGYYDQKLAGLNPGKNALNQIWDSFPNLSQGFIRTALAVFLFKGDDVFKPISSLSGGERARIALLSLMLSKANFLLLDEPTNHLDIPSREALEGALMTYGGTLFIISHDRYFINKMADRVLYLDSSGMSEYGGNYDYFLNHFQKSGVKTNAPVPKVNSYKQKKEQESAERKKAGEIKRLEAEIEKKEKESHELSEIAQSEECVSDYSKLMDITKQLEETHKLLEEMYLKWEELAD